jgi:allene oxide cyclase
MSRVLYVLAAVVAALLFTSQAAEAGKQKPKVKKFSAYAVVDSATFVDNDPAGDSQGDLLAFTQKLWADESQTRQIGSDEVYCVRTIVGASRVCTGIITVKGGELMITGRESLERHSLAITGGTGKWRNARGEVILEPASAIADQMTFKVTVKP